MTTLQLPAECMTTHYANLYRALQLLREAYEAPCHDCNDTGVTGWGFPCRSCDALEQRFTEQGRAMPLAWKSA